MNRFFLSIIVGLLFLQTSFAQNKEILENQKPNVIIVMTDDQGKNDLACEGNPWVKTPAIDKFYSSAVRLTNFHVSTTCTPTRGALMTGRHTNRLNVFHTVSGRSLLFEDEQLLPEVFALNGYATAMYGKWHLGDNFPFRPSDRGFQEVVCHQAGGVGQGPDYWENDYFDDTYQHNNIQKKYEGYCTDVFFGEALKFIEKNKENPFLCYISLNAPHTPLNCPEEYIDRYKDVDISEQLKRLYGMITNIDDNFKRLEDKLEELNLTENTVLVFMTDNGSAKGSKAYSAGLRGGKGSQYEGGHRVPFYIRWPEGKLVGGRDVTRLTAHFDLLPTFVDLLDLNFTPQKPLDGKSIVSLLYGNDSNWKNRILYVDTQRLLDLVKYRKYSVMDDNWRLVNGNELYAINSDLAQKNNVIENHPEVVERLANAYEYYWESFEDEDLNAKYAYIKVGTPYENPVQLSGMDIRTTSMSAWHQVHARIPTPASGVRKIEFVTGGEYKICLRRFPRESGLTINATFPEKPTEESIQSRKIAGSIKNDFVQATLQVASVKKKAPVDAKTEEIIFNVNIPKGKYDLEASLIDKNNQVYPVYYVYVDLVELNK